MRNTPERKCRDDYVDRSSLYDICDMSSTHIIYLTLCTVFSLELCDTQRIILDDDESSMRRLASDELSCHLAISSTELDYRIYSIYLSEWYDLAYQDWSRSESIPDVWPEFFGPEFEIHNREKSTDIVSILFKMQMFSWIQYFSKTRSSRQKNFFDRNLQISKWLRKNFL